MRSATEVISARYPPCQGKNQGRGIGNTQDIVKPRHLRAFCIWFVNFHVHHPENPRFQSQNKSLPSTITWVLNIVYVPSVIFIPHLGLDYVKDTAVLFILSGPYTGLDSCQTKEICSYQLVHISFSYRRISRNT